MGLGTHKQLLESKVVFDLPPKDAVIGLGNIKRVVLVNDVEIIKDAAIINGYLHMSIVYNTVNKNDFNSYKDSSSKKEKNNSQSKDNKDDKNNKDNNGDKDNKDNKDNKESYNDTGSRYPDYSSYFVGRQESSSSKDQKDENEQNDQKNQKNSSDNKDKSDDHDNKKQCNRKENKCSKKKKIVVDGVVRQSNIWIPFESIIFVPGANKGDSYQIISSKVAVDVLAQTMIYDDDNIDEQDEQEKKADAVITPFNMSLIKGFYERDLINIEISVS